MVALAAAATTVQLGGGGRRLAVPSGAVEAAPHPEFGSFLPRAVGAGFWWRVHSVAQQLCLRDDGVGDKFVAMLRQVNVVPVSVTFETDAFVSDGCGCWCKNAEHVNYFEVLCFVIV